MRVADSFSMGVGRCLPLESIIFGALHRTVLGNRLGPNRELVRVTLTRELNIDEAPVERTVHGLRRRNLMIVVPEHNTRITGVARGSLGSILRIHVTLRGMTVRGTYTHVARRRVEEL